MPNIVLSPTSRSGYDIYCPSQAFPGLPIGSQDALSMVMGQLKGNKVNNSKSVNSVMMQVVMKARQEDH